MTVASDIWNRLVMPPRPSDMGMLVAVSVGAALVLSACSSVNRGEARGGMQQGSCVAPFLRSDNERRPPSLATPTTLGRVTPGEQVTVFGKWYFAGSCKDVFGPGEAQTPAQPDGSVPLHLISSDRSTRVVATGTPSGPEATFAETFAVPNDAPNGPARITDDQGHVVTLTIAQR